ncbi:hypothetical protein WJX72_010497 [[Myrmecia] bisecta]|uniref:Cytidyltransferase-like domain-containing protein n=1 Tax=[Myrmecia] bisecta TaxID=41462 RepID=A0AAW1Q6F2_9CHLO
MSTARKRLYLWFQGPGAALPPRHALLGALASYYDEVASRKPTLDVIPLFAFAGHTPESVATLPCLEALLSSAAAQDEATQLADQLNHVRSAQHQPELHVHVLHLDTEPPRADLGDAQSDPNASADGRMQLTDGHQQPGEPAAASLPTAGQPSQHHRSAAAAPGVQASEHWQPGEGPQQMEEVRADGEVLQFENVAVGGTFDRLHAGHRVLLAATALVATKSIYIGITADALLAKKANKELLESFDMRRDAAVDFVKAVHPGIEVTAGALVDPNEPTMAATDERMQALVVSQETISGAEAINQYRREHGLKPLKLVIVNLVESSCFRHPQLCLAARELLPSAKAANYICTGFGSKHIWPASGVPEPLQPSDTMPGALESPDRAGSGEAVPLEEVLNDLPGDGKVLAGETREQKENYAITVSNASGYLCHIHMECTFQCLPEVVYAIFTNPDNTGVFRDIKQCGSRKVLEEVTEGAGVRRKVEVEQIGEARVMWMKTDFSTLLRVTEDSTQPDVWTTSFELIKSAVLSRFAGSWVIHPVCDASGTKVVSCRSILDQDILPKGVPSFLAHVPVLGSVLRAICVRAVLRMIEDINQVIDKVRAGVPLEKALHPSPADMKAAEAVQKKGEEAEKRKMQAGSRLL